VGAEGFEPPTYAL